MTFRFPFLRTFFVSRTVIYILGALVLLVSGLLSYDVVLKRAIGEQSSTARERLMLLSRALDYTVGTYDYLPDVLSQASPIIDAFRNPGDAKAIAAANAYLKSLNEVAGSADLYIVDRNGTALAASNFDRETTFVGQNYAFRPYFTDALTKGEGRYYAVGATTGQPGYFLWHAVPDPNGGTLGVAVVKIDLLHLQDDWRNIGDLVALVDSNRVIFLSSRRDWLYRPMLPLSDQQIQRMRQTQQYGDNVKAAALLAGERSVKGFPVETIEEGEVLGEYLAFSRNMSGYGWRLFVLTDFAAVQTEAAIATGGVMLATLAGMLIFLVTHQRRQITRAKLNAHNVLEQRVAARTTELTATNIQLSNEIDQRIRIEQNLRRAQDNLIHATKMASLGQALAGVAHEINQSLAALRTYIASTQLLLQRSDKDRASSNLVTISSIVERMGELTQHLKSFARKETVAKQSMDLGAAVQYGLKLLDYRIASEDVELTLEVPRYKIYVMGNTIRLEQVVVNLISNALDAVHDQNTRKLSVRLYAERDEVILEVSDNGPGMPPETISMVFDPFYTTKDVGEGLGLGLSISYGIIKDMEGEITVNSDANRGTTFRVRLPRAAQIAASMEASA